MKIEIDGATYDLTCTCGACPEQYDVHREGEKVGYLRLRHGIFEAEVPDACGRRVYSAVPEGDGMFEDDERDGYLETAVRAVHAHIGGAEYDPRVDQCGLCGEWIDSDGEVDSCPGGGDLKGTPCPKWSGGR